MEVCNMGFFAVILIGVAIYFLVKNGTLKTNQSASSKSPLDIVGERYANGEIDEQTYKAMKDTLSK